MVLTCQLEFVFCDYKFCFFKLDIYENLNSNHRPVPTNLGLNENVKLRYKVGLNGITVLTYTRIFRNPNSTIFNNLKNTDAHLSIKLIWRGYIEGILYAEHIMYNQRSASSGGTGS